MSNVTTTNITLIKYLEEIPIANTDRLLEIETDLVIIDDLMNYSNEIADTENPGWKLMEFNLTECFKRLHNRWDNLPPKTVYNY